MVVITTFDSLDQEIKRAEGSPIVLEALWSGDINGWYLLFYLYTVTSRFFMKTEQRHFLGEITAPEGSNYYTDGRITVALLAEVLGKQAFQKYSLTFYFPCFPMIIPGSSSH